MKSYHIHISGQVQGVGFRPFVYRLAEEKGVKGWISNSSDGVHIELTAPEETAREFYQAIVRTPPLHAIITEHHIHEIPLQTPSCFVIKESIPGAAPHLMLTPDIGLCEECRREVLVNDNRWFRYPFTTCLRCGPRYSIMDALPYDRATTRMAPFTPCAACTKEYNDVYNRRHYSQTISCPGCAIPMHLYDATGLELPGTNEALLAATTDLLGKGEIMAVKGIGGYLLLCDATNDAAIADLRRKKHRPAKPLALLYPDSQALQQDAELSAAELAALQDSAAPIVLCTLRNPPGTGICTDLIAPGLGRIGAMLPYSPLLLLISAAFRKPLIATSGNISGAPIIYTDSEALSSLNEIARYVLTYERGIVVPQDDSVIQFTPAQQRIVLRRSRGMAPTYHPNPFDLSETVLAMGGELKSAFALTCHHHLYVSQYLGDQGVVESQEAYRETLDHLLALVQASPVHILIDKHPSYAVSVLGKEMASLRNAAVTSIQHHEAHFGAVLAENNLTASAEPVLGVIWDGTGYGDDDQIWGGECFVFEDGDMHRVAHLDYFTQLLGDKMSREPRLSALSLLKNFPSAQHFIQNHFSETEWAFYQKQVQQPGQLLTSSMGRLLDGLSSLLGICQLNSYEGEAAMRLEALAVRFRHHQIDYYPLPLTNKRLDHNVMLHYLLEDLDKGEDVAMMAWKIFGTLAKAIETTATFFGIRKLAFSGGVFQNELLTDLVQRMLGQQHELYFHRQLSPNDECIGFGQLACYELSLKKHPIYNQQSTYAG